MASIVETEAKMRKRGRWLCRAGWAAFGISLALPAYHVFGWMSGWDCFRFVFDVARGKGGWLGGTFYYSGFALANSIFLLSPLLIRFFRRDLRWLRRFALLVAGATLYTASFLVFAIPGGWKAVGDLHIGYYVWLLSFGLVTDGTLHLAMRRPNVFVNQKPSVTGRTKEEMLAMRELEDYLSGVDRPCNEEEQTVNRVPGAAESAVNPNWNPPGTQNVNGINFWVCLRPRIAEG